MGGWCVVTLGSEEFCQVLQCPDGWGQAMRLAELRAQTMPTPTWTHFVRHAFVVGEHDERGPASDEVFDSAGQESV